MNKNLNELLELKNYVNYLIEMVLTENPYNLNAMGMKHVQNYYKPSHAASTVVKKPTIDNTTKIAQGKVDDILARKRIDSMKPIPQKDFPVKGATENPYKQKINDTFKEYNRRHGTDPDKNYTESGLTGGKMTRTSNTQYDFNNTSYNKNMVKKAEDWDNKYSNDKVYKDTLKQIGKHDSYVKNGPPKPMTEKQTQIKSAIVDALGKK